MKKLLIACLLATGWANAQNITFKDPAFKNYLVDYVYYKGQNLVKLDLDKDGEISIDEAKEPTELYIQNDSTIISTEGIENFINLTNLQITDSKKIKKLDVSGINTLKNIMCQNLDELNEFNGSKYLEDLYISNSYNLSSCDFSLYSKLFNLHLENVSFNITNQSNILLPDNLTNLTLVKLSISNLSSISIDFSKSLKIENLLLRDMIINNFDFSKNTKLKYIYLDNTNITQLDVTNQNLDFLYTYKNISLSNIFMKNNFKSNNLYFKENSSLKYICADELEIDNILDTLIANGLKNVEVNSFCSFTPGGESNTITNYVKFDSNGECNGNDSFANYTKFNIEDQNGIGYSVTDKDGIVQFYKQKGNYTLNPLLENPTYFNISPQTVNFNLIDNSGHDTTINFCITPNGVHKDVEVVLAPYGPARPGFNATYVVTYKNKGNQTVSGDISVTYDDKVLDFVKSTMTSNNAGSVTTSYVDLKPFEIRVDTLVLRVNSPVDTPAVNINDTLKFIATINPSNEDVTPNDNVFSLNQRVVGAYDPNLITCLEGNELNTTQIGKTLHYTIEFENTGNYPAENIVVVEEIDPKKYDINSIQILNTSHPMKFRVEGNKVEYYFEKIQLGEHKHGNILLKLHSNEELQEGSEVNKQANIYFDYNAPVQTNNEKTVYRELKASIAELKEDVNINVYPNPGNGLVNVNAAKNIKLIEVYDVNGRVIQSKITNANQVELHLTDEITGVYFIKVITEEGANVIKYQKD